MLIMGVQITLNMPAATRPEHGFWLLAVHAPKQF